MKLEITDLHKADVFVQCFQHMKTFVDNINIVFKEEQLYIQAIDHSMILIMEFSLPSEWFESYSLSESITVGINCSLLSKVLSIRDKTQKISWTTEENPDKLNIAFHAENSKLVFDKGFELPLIDFDTELLAIPPIDYPAEFTLPTVIFANMIHQLKQFGDTLNIECTEEYINMVSDSVEYGTMNTHMPIEDLEEYAINEGQTVKSGYGLKYLGNVCLYQKVAKSIFVGVSDSFPMKIQFLMENDAQMTFYLAPKVVDE